MTEQTPWTGKLSVDLRRGSLSVRADGLALIDEKHVCWGIIFPNKDGFYTHAATIANAVNHNDAVTAALEEAVRLIDALLGLEKGSADAALAFIGRYGADVGSPPTPSAPDASAPARRPRE